MFSKSSNISRRRPFVEKLGSMIWTYDDNVIKQLDAAKAIGLKYMRMNVYIKNADLDSGIGNFSTYDFAISEAKKRGFSLLISFHGETPVANNADTNSQFTPERLAAFKKLTSDFIISHKGNNIVWEAFNEANGDFWTTSPESKSDVVIKAWTDFDLWLGAFVKENDQGSTFATLCSISYYNAGFGKYKVAKDSVKKADSFGLFDENADLISFHPYIPSYANSGRPEVLIRDSPLSDLSPRAKSLPLIATEFGYSRDVASPKYNWQGLWSMADAIKYTVRESLIMDYLGWPIIIQYSLSGSNYSFLGPYASLTPLSYAYYDFIKRMRGFSFYQKIKVIDNPSDFMQDLYCLEYHSKSKVMIVYWSPIGEVTHSASINGQTMSLDFSEDPKFLEVQ
ncbi:hypothetical protein [Lacticaseibacillus paracasei]|uniref:hypothetical protein n=1 Tax=Lacticaseibacillus paracasei TaxID=1597 RepID=UPI0021A618A3|nr:hypothetical protein [Lacticaseibacillus paracasei]MCT2893704.1 hypothetical protein [Lacticaseibacillus paracasei]